MSELKQKIWAKMNQPTIAALATITEDGKPWVRYCTPRMDENLTIWMATFIHSRKVGQIQKNPEIHLTVGITTMETAESYLQIQGRAEILTDAATKQAVWFAPLGNIFSGPDDPNYCVLKVTPYHIEYQTMGMAPAQVWEP